MALVAKKLHHGICLRTNSLCAIYSTILPRGRHISFKPRYTPHCFQFLILSKNFYNTDISDANKNNTNDGDGRDYIRNIRRACKTGNHAAALEQFSKLQLTGQDIRPDVINSLFHVTAQAKDEKGFDDVLAVSKKLGIAQDFVMQSNLVSGLSKLGRVDEALGVCVRLEEEGGKLPRQQALQALLDASLRKGLDVGVLRTLHFLTKGNHHPGTDNSVLLMESVLPGGELAGRQDLVHELLSLYRALNCEMEAPVADRILRWADSSRDKSCTKSVISMDMECSHCRLKIDTNEPTLEEYLQLQGHIHYMLERDIQSFLDTKRSITEMIQLKELVRQEGSFAIVVDGLNVGFFEQREFSVDRLKLVAVHCAQEVGKVLVIARSHIQKHMLQEGVPRNQRGVFFHRMEDHDVHFLYVRNRIIDDLFFVYATLVSSPDTFFLSNDQLGDISRDFPKNLSNVFRKWQKFKQVSLMSKHGPRRSFTPILQFPLPYDPMVQRHSNGQGWHIPVKDSRTWLCLQHQICE